MARIRAVIFDWAGTTVDFGSRAPVNAFLDLFRQHDVVITMAEARAPMGRAKRDHIAAIAAMPRVQDAWRNTHGRSPGEADIERMYAAFVPLQKAVLLQHADVIPGVREVVADLCRRGVKVGSTTGYTRNLMDVLMPAASAAGFTPDHVICADDVPAGRPAPWMLFRSAERLGVYPMSDIVVVDDTVVGIEAARNAGAQAVAVTTTGNAFGLTPAELQSLAPAEIETRHQAAAQAFLRAGAQRVIASVADLLPVLEDLHKA